MELNTKPTLKQAKAGLRQRPTYAQIVGVIEKDEKVELPDRRYKFLMDDPQYNALTNVPTMDALEDQQMKVIYEQQKDALMVEKAIKSKDMGVKELKSQDAQTSTATPKYFDMAVGDEAPMEEDEQDVQEEVQGRKEQKQNKINIVKDIVKTRVRNIRTTVDRLITPTPPQKADADTQTTAQTTTGVDTQTDPVQASEPHPVSINKKVQSKIQEEKVKKVRKKKVMKEEVKDELKAEVMNVEPQEPKPVPEEARGRSRSRKPRGPKKAKEEVKDEVKEEVKEEKKAKSKPRGRSRSRSKKKDDFDGDFKEEVKDEEIKDYNDRVKKRAASEPKAGKSDKKNRTEPKDKKRPSSLPKGGPSKIRAMNPTDTPLQPRVLKTVTTTQPTPKAAPKAAAKAAPKAQPKAAPKAKARARSDSVEMGSAKLNDSTDKHYWEQQSGKEIRNNLALRGVNKNLYVYKFKAENIDTLINAIKAAKAAPKARGRSRSRT